MPPEKLSLDTEDQGGVRILRLTGRCTVASNQVLKDAVQSSLAEGKQRIIFDLGGCDFMDSAGLGCLVACRFSCARKGGALILCNVSAGVLSSLRLARLDHILPIHRTLRSAVAAAQEPDLVS